MAKLFVKFSERHPEPQPMKVNSKLAVLIGTLIWGVVLLVLIAFYPALSDAGLQWWLHTAITGIILGFVGWLMVRKS
jgi:uncharacterized membrane protein